MKTSDYLIWCRGSSSAISPPPLSVKGAAAPHATLESNEAFSHQGRVVLCLTTAHILQAARVLENNHQLFHLIMSVDH